MPNPIRKGLEKLLDTLVPTDPRYEEVLDKLIKYDHEMRGRLREIERRKKREAERILPLPMVEEKPIGQSVQEIALRYKRGAVMETASEQTITTEES